jgi:hypothetical protein
LHTHAGHAGHDLDVNRMALSATLHCLTGCAIGEVVGVIIGTALGWSNAATIFLAIALAFLFGYTLTSWPLLRAGLALATVVPIAFASDTLSIAVMEIVDNAIILVIPGAMDAGLDDVLFWGSLSFALFVAGFFAYPVNRWLLQRGKGHAAVHETGIHGGPDPRLVGVIAAAAGLFGAIVLIADAI